jgi:single-strand DNA-binding protein
MSFAKVTVVGNLGADPELRYMPNGNPVTSFSICANERRGSGEDRTEKQLWFKANVFGNSAEAVATHLKKGDPVYLEGRINPELWKGRDGETRLTMNINTSDVQFLAGMKRNRAGEAGGEAGATSEAAAGDGQVADDDVPF